MMNKDIITLNTNIVQSHQVTINIGIPMKREREADMPCRTPPMMSFSFSWCFDEKMMNIYTIILQLVMVDYHQFIVFTHRLPLCKL